MQQGTTQLNYYEKKLKKQVLEQKPKKQRNKQEELRRLKKLAKELNSVQASKNASSE